MARLQKLPEPEGVLPDELVEQLLRELTPVHRLFLSGLGRGLSPVAAARRAGWDEAEAEKVAAIYMDDHPVVSRLAAHILLLRELATLDGEEPVLKGSGSVH
jgi:hypothetical protein